MDPDCPERFLGNYARPSLQPTDQPTTEMRVHGEFTLPIKRDILIMTRERERGHAKEHPHVPDLGQPPRLKRAVQEATFTSCARMAAGVILDTKAMRKSFRLES